MAKTALHPEIRCETCLYRSATGGKEHVPCCVCVDSSRWRPCAPAQAHEASEFTITLEATKSGVDSKIAAGSKKSAPFMFALAELQYAAITIDGIIGIEEDRRSVALGFWLRRRREGPFLFDHEARPLAIAAYYLLWEMVAAEGADPYSALPEVWRVSLFGEGKHGANNWMNAKPEGMWHYEAALWRHIIESTWEEKAEDSGCYHLAHAVWNALMLLEMEMRGVVNPDWETGDGKDE